MPAFRVLLINGILSPSGLYRRALSFWKVQCTSILWWPRICSSEFTTSLRVALAHLKVLEYGIIYYLVPFSPQHSVPKAFHLTFSQVPGFFSHRKYSKLRGYGSYHTVSNCLPERLYSALGPGDGSVVDNTLFQGRWEKRDEASFSLPEYGTVCFWMLLHI